MPQSNFLAEAAEYGSASWKAKGKLQGRLQDGDQVVPAGMPSSEQVVSPAHRKFSQSWRGSWLASAEEQDTPFYFFPVRLHYML